ncbi:MAG: 50S ribosomal protein L22 [Candidatus Woesebacteria bacterium GW2011_GWB1_38_5b]|uniref:Large ribosomal subunit protein uL22 n=2 Tax=Candidatus Woeseibacteriota TaxID=1752722 RepID=A0A0G0K289_9BACT|nr:MAG: 50S ribosomal protein L22 [Candidatus Woesebacteria bacterium GW2011_GWB1_38_5b]OGM19155.1 MAG: hypothetical protein A2686_00095 [Candidatus Woesebacteria bacterium RIFCSPHIGHO2_01_FULL_38_10]OGM58924.1 MAG: hypothetical protein A2892_05000 [Candidatus Woesebacteria bacterium RIFCSPLOWO2_01_FULL_39_10b]
MDVKVVQKFIVTSPKKLRETARLVKNLEPREAVERLPFLRKKAAFYLRKVILTALADAKQKGIGEEKLTFKEIQVNEGPRLKRWRAGARGRAKPYKKRTSHIRVILVSKAQKASGKAVKVQSKTENTENLKNKYRQRRSKVRDKKQ